MDRRTMNFIDLYFESLDENIEEVKKDLSDAGIDLGNLENGIIQSIKKAKAEIKIEKGKEFKTTALKVIHKVQLQNKEFEETPEFRIAARNLGKLDKQDENEIKKNEMILKELDKILNQDN